MHAFRALAVALHGLLAAHAADTPSWTIPLAGNAYLTGPAEGSRDGIGRDGLRWRDPGSSFSVFFHLDRAATLDLSLEAAVPAGGSRIRATVGGRAFEATLDSPDREHPLGRVEVDGPGYLRVDLEGLRREGEVFARPQALGVRSDTPGLTLDYVKSNEGNMFYWGRRGPSVHLHYRMPRGRDIEYAYSELTVPEGEDPIGSYFMANGFGQGYFGIQVKGPDERWVLFSVWSPFKTNNPREIPEEDRVVTLAKGPGVTARDFGHEGSGGQSFLRYPWKAGTTYRFLTRVRPDGRGNTVYTAWFGDKDAGEWQLIASFRRPKTDTWYTGFHAFLENFAPDRGHLGRRARYGNPWVRDRDGAWHEITEARFTGDGTARGGHRLDYAGGLEGRGFFLRNGGFFDDRVALDQRFERAPTPGSKPAIDLDALPGGQ